MTTIFASAGTARKTQSTLRRAMNMLGRVRVSDLTRIARRLVGLPYLRAEDFIIGVTKAEAEKLADLAKHARGDAPPPVLVLGVLPRSGTNFIFDALANHPDVVPSPNRLYEFPLLHAARAARMFTEDFLDFFPANREHIGRFDLLAMLAGAWLRELQQEAGDRRILLKSPHVQALDLATCLFPDAKIIVTLRDGRDLIDSWENTFTKRSIFRKNFRQLSQEWRLGAEAVMTFAPGGPRAHPDVTVLRYEDVQGGGEVAIGRLLAAAALDPESYDLAKFDALPVRGSSRPTKTAQVNWEEPEARDQSFRPVGRWKDWSPRRVRTFDRIAGAALEVAGYERHAV